MYRRVESFREVVCEEKCDKVRVCELYNMLKHNKMLRYLNISSCTEFVQVK